MIDALVIGAGPAGSLAALLLARSGWGVTLVEQHPYPRDKVCGECLSALGIDVLTRAGAARFPVEPVSLTRTLIHAPDGSSCELRLPKPMWGVSRHGLDHHLLNAAKHAGVSVLQPARCEGLPSKPTIRNLITNECQSIHARYTLRADGKAPPNQSSGDFGIKAHFVDVDGPVDAIELFGVDGTYGGLAPIEGNRWNAAFSVPAARLRAHRGDIDALFGEMTKQNQALAIRLRSARRGSPWLAAPLPRFSVQNGWTENVIPIGNAAAAMEPIGGEGMGLALRSAELAASALIRAKARGEAVDCIGLRRDYRQLWRTRSAACRAIAMGVSCAAVARSIVPAVDGVGLMTDVAMRLMGKG